jgi:hypothetical protein
MALESPMPLTSTQALLLACLRVDVPQSDGAVLERLDEQAWRDLLALATIQRVRPLVRRRLLALGGSAVVPHAVWRELESACLDIASLNLRLHVNCAAIVAALAAKQIPVIVLKGMHVASAIYGNIALREIGDIDLMVPREHLERAVAVVTEMGFQPLRPFSVELDAAANRHVSRLRRGRTIVELHWNITEPEWPFRIESALLWNNAVPWQFAGDHACTLSDEDAVLHLCMHASYQHWFEFGLRSLHDAAEIANRRGGELRWALVRQRAIDWRWTRGVYLALVLARDLLGAKVPDDVLVELRPEEMPLDVLESARAQVLLGFDGPSRIKPAIAALSRSRGIREGARHVYERIFLTRAALERHYPGRTASTFGRWRCYLQRASELLRSYSGTAFHALRRDEHVVSFADRQHRVRTYLDDAT